MKFNILLVCLTGMSFTPAGVFAANFHTTTDATPMCESPGGRTIATLHSHVTVGQDAVQNAWSAVRLEAWVHVSAFRLISSVGGKVAIGAGMGMNGESPHGPEVGRISRGATGEMAAQEGDFIKIILNGWIRSMDLKSGKAPKKPTPPPPPPPPPPPAPAPPAPAAPAVSKEPARIQFEDIYRKSWGVAIGISDYEYWPDLPQAARDAAAVKAEMEKQKFDHVDFLSEKDATRKAIESLLGEELPSKVGENDRVLIYFSGHTSTRRGRGGTQKGFLIPADCPASNIFSAAISISRIREMLDLLPAKHILLVVDACVADPAADHASRPLDQIVNSRGVQVIAACRPTDDSESTAAPGLLTSSFLNGLGGEADRDNDGLISAGELFGHVQSAVAQTNSRAKPRLISVEGLGEMVFRRPGGKPRGPESAAKAPPIETKRVSEGKNPKNDGGAKALPYLENYADLRMEMVFVPGAWFQREGGREVYVDGFWMSKHEITVGQWRKFLAENSHLKFDWSKNSFGEHPVAQYAPADIYPIVNVSWNHAAVFAEWLTVKTGRTYRLPTEAEWEYAAGGGGKDEYATSTGRLDTNLANCSGCGSQWDNQQTSPVGSFPPNRFGIHDMSGNVWEWCEDWMGDYPTGKVRNPKGSSEGTHKVARGGSWNNKPELIRTAHRGSIRPGYRGQYLGFRVVSIYK